MARRTRRVALLLALAPGPRAFAPPRRPRVSVARAFDAGSALQEVLATPAYRFEAATVVLLASFASKVGQSPLKRPKSRVKPANVTKTEWRAGEIARWDLRSLQPTAADERFAVAFLHAWAERTCEVGDLRARARCALLDDGVRLAWISRGPAYLSAPEERALEKNFERISPDARGDRAKSSYAYAARSSSTAVGGVEVIVAAGADHPTLSVRRCGYDESEVVKEGSERTTVSLLRRDLKSAFDAS